MQPQGPSQHAPAQVPVGGTGQQGRFHAGFGGKAHTDDGHPGATGVQPAARQQGQGPRQGPGRVQALLPAAGQFRARQHQTGIKAQHVGPQIQGPAHIGQKVFRLVARHAGQQLHAQGKARVPHQTAGFGGLPAAVMAFTGLQGRIGKALDAQLHRAAAVAAQARQQGRIQTVGAGGAAEAGDAAVTPEAVGHVQTGVQVAGRQGREGAAVKGQLYRRPALCPPGVQIGGRTGQYLVQRTGLLACLVMLGTKNTAAGTAEKRDENAEDRDCPCRSLP